MNRRRRILDAAAEAFDEKGFHGVGVDELGARAGLSGPTLYRHFSGKHEILAALMNEAMDELLTATTPVHADPDQDLWRAVRHHIQFALAKRPLITVYQREVRALVDPWRADFSTRLSDYTERWEALVARRFPDMPPGEVAATTQAGLGLVFSVTTWPKRARSVSDVEELILGVLVGGMGHELARNTPDPRSG